MKLVIVESPTKSKTISRFLGKGYTVESSYGHIRDLPSYKLGVDVENNFEPQYVIPRKVQPVVKKLKALLKKADTVILATDEDREGEAIAWHLLYAMGIKSDKEKKQTKKEKELKIERIVFHEITKKAIQEALSHPRDINADLIAAQQARRVLDRLVGYKLSPFLWKKIARGLSAGRVQSVALRLVVEREEEIKKFNPQKFWTIAARVQKKGCTSESGEQCAAFDSQLYAIDGVTIEKPGITEKQIAEEAIASIDQASFRIIQVEKRKRIQRPSPPFTTATLQQAAWSRLRFSAKKTMLIAQQLYEGVELTKGGAVGLITYMRTDSLNIAEEALHAVRGHIKDAYGDSYVPEAPREFKKKAKGAQEAHEAIRPVDVTLLPDAIKNNLTSDQYRLYSLIWRRFVASQMNDAEFEQTTFVIDAGAHNKKTYQFRTTGSILRFDGFLKVSPMKKEDTLLPVLQENDTLAVLSMQSEDHETQPPPRYTEASLIKALEKFGIGRPSTYAPTMSTIQDRHYVVRNDQKQFEPTEIGEKVNALLVEHFPQIVDIEFTADMEQKLDEVAEGEKEWRGLIKDFYEPFAKVLEEKYETVAKEDMTETIDEMCPECGKQLMIRHGRFGKFISCSGFPDCKFTKALPPEPLGIKCPKCKDGDVVERRTRKRRVFYGCSRYPDCDFAVWQRPTGTLCPECGQALVQLKSGIKCSNKECSYKEEHPDSEDSV
ncbi:MAG: type I DNA topoisomerase [Candidatus Niyogibacteria bacterium CG10_big_fil_rev_8_21_14_0_10_46_36]|uniref:DNA topoisomerase 1 n=1 Tax=Candidatus Niyogibacteria bacterium CG10_big_fil_rev_8_21_14_0_10_46_36 TaxID=1974726 RepID=A0A2H0TDR0_9BACT|nr:MAG: type I DNA topoisomerase [Candidatus Niyogibacteria bacterium CG10_big_fil_rev_8_21_14_0_10_46_36]